MSKTAKSIVGGMTVLSIVGIVSKVIGALHRIPLAWMIGDTGMGIYQLVFPTYNMLLAISSAGLPVAISRMVSYSLAQDDPRNAKKILRIAISFLTALGFLSMLLMILFSPQLAIRSKDPRTELGFIAIAPALLLVCTMSALRGFMQGQQNMVPTAISQFVEQVAKVIIALPLAYFGSRISMSHAVAGVLLGTSIAEALALLFMFIAYCRNRKDFVSIPQNPDLMPQSAGSILKKLVVFSIPVTISACIVPLSAFIDSGLLLGRLILSGMEQTEATALYGRYSGYVLTIINVPSAIAAAISMSLVPSISAAIARGDGPFMRKQSALGLRLSFTVGMPCTVALIVISERVLSLMFDIAPENLAKTGNMLCLSAITIVLFTVVQSTSGILQGLKKQWIPMYTLLAGVVVKIFLNYTLIALPDVNIYGASLASITCYTISMLPNLFFVHKYTGLKVQIVDIFLKPALASLFMGGLLYGLSRLLPEGRLWTVLIVFIGIASYAFFALLTGALKKSDLAPLMRRGRKQEG